MSLTPLPYFWMPILHSLIEGDTHLDPVRCCMCFGPCCMETTGACICSECRHSVVRPTPPPELEPVVAENPETLFDQVLEHACQDCGAEVFRNGTRGRYPLRCPNCKAKR